MRKFYLLTFLISLTFYIALAQKPASKETKAVSSKNSPPRQKGKFSFESDADCNITLNGKEIGNLKSGKTKLSIGFVGDNELEVAYGFKAAPGSAKTAKKESSPSEVKIKKTITLPDTGISTYLISFYNTEQLNTYLRDGNKTMVDLVLSNNPSAVKPIDDNSLNPLIIAINKKDASLVKMLLEKGADPNLVTGSTPLNTAISSGKADIVQLLIESGAKVNVRGDNGKMPIEEAVFWSKLDIVKMLLDKGANPNEKDANGTSLIEIATDKGYNSIVNELKTHGAN
jgi:hypothetical protein